MNSGKTHLQQVKEELNDELIEERLKLELRELQENTLCAAC